MNLRRLAFTTAILAALPASAAWAQQQSLPQPFESQELRQLDAWSVSGLPRAEGGLEANLWANSDPDFVAVVFDRLPAAYESPAVQNLARRVLLSGGDAPRGDAAAAGRKRFEALGRMGAADPLANMAAGAGVVQSDPAIATYSAQAELARGRRAEACQRARATPGDQPVPFLLRLRAYCAAVGGDRAAADLALELARGTGPEDAWYTGAIAAAGGAPGARPPVARYDNSLNTQLSMAAGLRPGPTPLQNASSLALVALARSENAPQPVRAQAAALAFRRGLLSPQEARTVLRATPAEITSGLPQIATTLREVEAAPGSLAAATAIANVLRQATTPADFAAAARFFKDDIAALTTAPDAPSTLLFARAALAADDTALSTRLVQSAAQAGVDATALAPLEAALSVQQRARGDAARLAAKRRVDAGGASMARAAARDVAILGALGFPLDGATQSFLLANPPQGGTRAEPGAIAALGGALARRATGEGALLVAVAAGDGPARLDTDSVCELIRALRTLGLEDEARRFAVEAILAGPPA